MAAPLVLHVLPVDLARGAQTYARDLRLALDGPDAAHRTVTLFRSAGGALAPDWSLGITPGVLRRAGADPRAVLRLRRLIKTEAPAIVVAHGGEPLKYAVLAGVPRERLVYLKIGIGGDLLHGLRGRIHRALLARVATVGAVSDDAARELLALGLDAKRVHVIPNGRDPAVYQPRAAAASATGAPAGAPVRLVFVGHLTETKRPVRFVDLVARLRAEGCAVEGVIAGDGPLVERVRDSARAHPVEVLGRVTDVPAVLAAADVFVFTSVTEGEGMPGVLIEAGLAGLPVVTTDVPGARSIVADGVTGYVVPVDDLDVLVGAVRVLVDDAELRHRFGAAARQRCEDEFSLELSVARWDALFDELIHGPCASST